MPLPVRSVVTLALVLVSSTAAAASHAEARVHKRHTRARAAPVTKLRECVKAPVQVVSGTESATFSLAKCDGEAAEGGVHQLSNLARVSGARRLDTKLVERLELAVDHFRKGVDPARIVLVSGYRPQSKGSFHATGKALDFRIEGVDNQALVAFCKTLPDTGCGFYPNSVFVHMDVRAPNTGHIAWTDLSRPGEAPHYVTADEPRASALPALPGKTPDTKVADQKPVAQDDRNHTL